MTTAQLVPTTDAQREALTRLMSGGRLNTYTNAATNLNRDDVEPLDFYVYNMALSSGFLGPLHILEVVARNSMHKELTTIANGVEEWWSVLDLTSKDKDRIEKAKKKVADDRNRKKLDEFYSADDVVAAADFGLWCSLLGRGDRRAGIQYEQTLWQKGLQDAFPLYKGDRNRLWKLINDIRDMRNRIAHHEPIHHHGDHERTYQGVIRLIGFVSNDSAKWVFERARIGAVIRNPPGATKPTRFF